MTLTWFGHGGGLPMSAVAWMQAAILFGYTQQQVTGAICAATGFARTRTAHDWQQTERLIRRIAYKLPMFKTQAACAPHVGDEAYSSWHTPHPGWMSHSHMCGVWELAVQCLLFSK